VRGILTNVIDNNWSYKYSRWVDSSLQWGR